MGNDYKVGQVWEDREGDRWLVVKHMVTGELYFKDDAGWGCSTGLVEEQYSPLKLVEGVRDFIEKVHPGDWIDKDKVAEYITKDSGERAEFESGMVRDTDKGKARWDLLIPEGVPYQAQMLTRFADLMARGAEKYDPRNWEQANGEEELARFKGSALRHLMQWFCGEIDEDHASAVLFNVLAFESTKYKIEESE